MPLSPQWGGRLSSEKTVSIKDIEALLVCLPGIQKARVVISDWGAIEEIHILTGLGRNPKQIVRDVQSALKAQWDITVDRRKISVAQIRVGLPEPMGRLRYAGIEIKTDARSGKTDLCVTLERPFEGQMAVYVGRVQCESHESAALLGVAKATCLAVNSALEPPHAFFVDDISVFDVGSQKAIAVLVDLLTPRRNQEQMIGCAIVRRDLREACVRATLDGLNRRLEAIPQKGSIIRDCDKDAETPEEGEQQEEVEPLDGNPGLFTEKEPAASAKNKRESKNKS